MKKIRILFVVILTTLAMIITSIGLFGCNKDGQELNFATAYDYSAITGIGILNTEVATAGSQGYVTSYRVLAESEKTEIINNLAIAQNLSNTGVIKTEVAQADREGYEFYYTVKAADYTGAEKEYKFYYNRTDITTKEDLRENEQEFKLDGLVILNGVEYTMVGNQEIEDNETEFTFKVALDVNNYVIIEQDTERKEIGFEYAVYKNGRKVFETEVEYEIDRKGNVELNFEILDTEKKVAKEYEYEFYKNGNEQFARIKVEEGKNTIVFATVKITATANGFEYTFVD